MDRDHSCTERVVSNHHRESTFPNAGPMVSAGICEQARPTGHKARDKYTLEINDRANGLTDERGLTRGVLESRGGKATARHGGSEVEDNKLTCETSKDDGRDSCLDGPKRVINECRCGGPTGKRFCLTAQQDGTMDAWSWVLTFGPSCEVSSLIEASWTVTGGGLGHRDGALLEGREAPPLGSCGSASVQAEGSQVDAGQTVRTASAEESCSTAGRV